MYFLCYLLILFFSQNTQSKLILDVKYKVFSKKDNNLKTTILIKSVIGSSGNFYKSTLFKGDDELSYFNHLILGPNGRFIRLKKKVPKIGAKTYVHVFNDRGNLKVLEVRGDQKILKNLKSIKGILVIDSLDPSDLQRLINLKQERDITKIKVFDIESLNIYTIKIDEVKDNETKTIGKETYIFKKFTIYLGDKKLIVYTDKKNLPQIIEYENLISYYTNLLKHE